MRSSEKKFEEEDIHFFLELAATLAMIVFLWGLLGGCAHAQTKEHPPVSLSTARIMEQAVKPPAAARSVKKRPGHRTRITRYRVRRGDTLCGIARRQGIAVKVLARANGLTDSSHLKTGETLSIPQ